MTTRCELATGQRFGLTGSVYSRRRVAVGSRARREYHVGNLYFNRKSTGALVGVHPFGGFQHVWNGTPKLAVADYLLLFTQAKSIAEKFESTPAVIPLNKERAGE